MAMDDVTINLGARDTSGPAINRVRRNVSGLRREARQTNLTLGRTSQAVLMSARPIGGAAGTAIRQVGGLGALAGFGKLGAAAMGASLAFTAVTSAITGAIEAENQRVQMITETNEEMRRGLAQRRQQRLQAGAAELTRDGAVAMMARHGIDRETASGVARRAGSETIAEAVTGIRDAMIRGLGTEHLRLAEDAARITGKDLATAVAMVADWSWGGSVPELVHVIGDLIGTHSPQSLEQIERMVRHDRQASGRATRSDYAHEGGYRGQRVARQRADDMRRVRTAQEGRLQLQEHRIDPRLLEDAKGESHREAAAFANPEVAVHNEMMDQAMRDLEAAEHAVAVSNERLHETGAHLKRIWTRIGFGRRDRLTEEEREVERIGRRMDAINRAFENVRRGDEFRGP